MNKDLQSAIKDMLFLSDYDTRKIMTIIFIIQIAIIIESLKDVYGENLTTGDTPSAKFCVTIIIIQVYLTK